MKHAMKHILLGASSAGILATVGCVQEFTYVDPAQNIGLAGGSNMALRDGFLAGDFGARRGIDGEATRLEGTSDRQYQNTAVNVVREQRGVGAGMVIVAVSGTTLEALSVGEHRFSYDEAELASEAIYVNVCSGDSASGFDYDQPAQNGTVTIEDAPNGLRTVDVHTEAPRLDPITGVDTGEMEESDATFTFQPQQG